MQVHEISRRAYLETLEGLKALEFVSDECREEIINAEWVVCYLPVSFGHVCKHATIFNVCLDDDYACEFARLREENELSRLRRKTKVYGSPVTFHIEVWHIIDNEPNDDDVYVCYSVVPFLPEQTEDGFEGCAGEIEFEDYEQALHCAKRLVNIQNPEGYKGIPYQTKMFHHVALTREITDFTNDLREEKTLCVLMPRMNRKYRGKELLGCAVNSYQEHDLDIIESLRQMREAAVM